MKKTAIVVAMLLLAVTAQAYIVVDADSQGIYVKFGTPVQAGPPVRPDFENDNVGSARAIIVWSDDTDIEGVVGSAVLGSARPSQDLILDTFYLSQGLIVPPTGDEVQYTHTSGEANGVLSESQFLAGYVYLVVFDTANPAVNDHYVAGSYGGIGHAWGQATDSTGDKKLTSITDPATQSGNYEFLDMTTASGSFVSGEYGANYIVLNSTVTPVPEPGTIGLMALGLLTMAGGKLRRRR